MSNSSSPVPPFPVHARSVVRAVRGAFSELLTSVGADPRDPQAISRAYGLNKNLAWKVAKIIQVDDPAVALQQLPGASGIKIFLKSMEQAGASGKLLETARRAIRDYEDLMEVHAGDRATLEMLGSTLGPEGRQQRDEYHRKQLFQGASYVWGAQARVVLKVGIVGPGERDGLLDFCSLNGFLGFRRFRPDVTWVLAARSARNDDGSGMFPPEPEAVDPNFSGPDQAPLMGDFCSKPFPELNRHSDATNVRFELPEGPVGNTGALDCVAGTVQRGLPYYRSANNEWGEHMPTCVTPTETLIYDLFIHESFAFAIPPEAALFSALDVVSSGGSMKREGRRLPLHEKLQDLGKGPLLLATPEVPRYSDMLQTMFDRVAWDPTQFQGFRMKIAYPACPTVLMLRYRLPEAPQ